jgi:hypothetical protein
MKEIIFLKGKESAWAGILLFFAVIIFIVPIAVILFFRALYRMVQIAKEQSRIPQGVSADLEKVY